MRNPRPSGANGTRPMPSSRSTGMISARGCAPTASTRSEAPRSGARRARGGWSARPPRRVRGSEPCPRCTRSAIVPTTSSIGTPRVDAVLVEQVDAVGARAGAASPRRPRGCAPAGCRRPPRACSLELEAELGGDDDAVACTPSRLSARPSSSSFVYGPYTSAVSKKRHAELEGAVDGGDRLALVALLGRAVGLAHAHAAEAERGDGETLGCRACACRMSNHRDGRRRGTSARTTGRSRRP